MSQIKDDLFLHYRERLRVVTLDHVDSCKLIGMPVEEIMSTIVAAMLHEMLIMVHAGGGDEQAVEEDIVQSCRTHFLEIRRHAGAA